MMKYKVGDTVKVRDDLIEGNWYGEQDFIVEMSDYKRKYVTIARISGEFDYEIKEDNGLYCWTDEMFEDNECEWFNAKGELELNGIILDANYEYQKIVKINPIALHYEDEGIKYVCPICHSLGVKLRLIKGKSNCLTCNVNLNWEE